MQYKLVCNRNINLKEGSLDIKYTSGEDNKLNITENRQLSVDHDSLNKRWLIVQVQ